MLDTDFLARLDPEQRTVRVLEEIMPGSSVMTRDDGMSGQIHDLDLYLGGEPQQAVEVTEATIEPLRRADSARSKNVKEAMIAALGLRHSWHVFPTSATSFKHLGKRLLPLLAKLEQDGVDGFFFNADAGANETVMEIMTTCGIEFGRRWQQSANPKIVVGLPNDGRIWSEGDSPGRYVQAAVSDEASKADNIEKLGRSGAATAHLFVWVDSRNYPPWKDLARGVPPTAPPDLADAITTVWVAGFIEDHLAVWRSTPPDGWEMLDTRRDAMTGLIHGEDNRV
ncbi:MAG: hypothetical protein JJLCMIEE_03584 [Acidimicrobiales bacterium]|nr:MAG: hypothetical protein EDR02_16105 [Actinomycetota bacterium]MBV6510437.1 hypothetical protein [Acidimicrobiales bacterium]